MTNATLRGSEYTLIGRIPAPSPTAPFALTQERLTAKRKFNILRRLRLLFKRRKPIARETSPFPKQVMISLATHIVSNSEYQTVLLACGLSNWKKEFVDELFSSIRDHTARIDVSHTERIASDLYDYCERYPTLNLTDYIDQSLSELTVKRSLPTDRVTPSVRADLEREQQERAQLKDLEKALLRLSKINTSSTDNSG